MNLQRLNASLNATSRLVNRRCPNRRIIIQRAIGTQAPEQTSKYADKLQQKAAEKGLSVSQLIEKANAEKAEQRKAEAAKLKLATNKLRNERLVADGEDAALKAKAKAASGLAERKDAPPFKALSSILNLPRLMSTPHTAEQISALWTTYHASRSGGTGRGFVCASVPLALYEKMAKNGRVYPTFVVPVPRIQQPDPTKSEAEDKENVAHEFYYLQWDFHPSPPIPSPSEDLFAKPTATPGAVGPNPSTSTVLFAPLQEYKLRQSFATPYLVLTMYTDLATTHGLVLLRGEITPSTAAGGGSDRYMMSQEDAQLMTMALQKFFLWGEESGQEHLAEGKELLKTFHEKPKEFEWQRLLKFSNLTI